MISPEKLRRCPVFAGLSPKQLDRIAAISHEDVFLAEDILFQEDQPAIKLFIVTEGEVDIVYESHLGPKAVDTLVAGDLAGWSAVVPPYRTTATGVARGDVSTIAIHAEELRALCSCDHELGYQLLAQVARVISHRLYRARTQLAV
jgi:CRP-like cAMP-binding protein